MKKSGAFAVLFWLLWASRAYPTVALMKTTPDGMLLSVDGGTLRIQSWSPDVVRVTFAAAAEIPQLNSLSVVGKPARVRLRRKETDRAFVIETPNLRVTVDKRTGAVDFADGHGRELLRESERKIAPATQPGVVGNACEQDFDLPADEGLYGLGQHQQGVWNYNTDGLRPVRLAQANTDVGIPVIASSRGYMLLWDNPAVTTISRMALGDSNHQGVLRWSSEWGKAIDYYFCYRDGTIGTALKAYRDLTGNAPLMPKWELGFWQCKERYASQNELLGVAKRLRDLKVPVDGIIQDWQYWPPGNNTWGSHQFDPARYPDPKGMFDELKGINYHTLISVWAKFDLGSDNSKQLNAVGGMFPEITKYVYPPGQGQWYDPFSLAGRETYWRQIRDELFAKGVDGWWLDAPEPEIGGMDFRNYATPLGPGYEVYNAYPLMHSTGIYQGQRAFTDKKRVVILTRSAYAGQQRNSAITWSGDIQGTWRVLKNQIPAGLNISLSGIPYWNTDTGGFFNNRSTGDGNPQNPQFQEFFTRWFQFSAFCPMFRVHSSSGLGPGREFYRFDEKTQGTLRSYLNLRYRLLPYLYSVAWQVTSNGSTFMRPLVMDFPHDLKAIGIGDQYLFGPAIMVTPVTSPGATTQSVYLPSAGAPWFNFWTGETSASGSTVETDAPVEILPLFVRPGSIIPMGPLLQYSSEKPADPVELRVYPGADGKFVLYEDEGDNYNYEKGAHTTIPLIWHDADGILEIGKRAGAFPGMLAHRTFKVIRVSRHHGAAISGPEVGDAVVEYTGKAVKVKLNPD